MHILANNLAAVFQPTNPKPTPSQLHRHTIRNMLHRLIITRSYVKIAVAWTQGHAKVEGTKRANKAAKKAVREVGARIEALASRRTCARTALRGQRGSKSTSNGTSKVEVVEATSCGFGARVTA